MSSFKHCDKLNATPLMCLIAGGTGSGKTYLLFQMLTTPGILDYEKLIIFTTTPEQTYFQFLKHGYENNLKKPVINKLFNLYSNGSMHGSIDDICKQTSHLDGVTHEETIPVTLTSDATELDQVNPDKLKTIVIFDDCVTERDQSVQCNMFTKGRHINCHSIYLSQSFYDVPKIIRKNANVFILFEQNDKSLTCILQSITTGMTNDAFRQLTSRRWFNPEEHGYVLINTRKQMDCRCYSNIFS